MIEKGYSLYVYDFKSPDLSTIAFNHLLNHLDKYGNVEPKFYVINFDDPERSHRCNPIHPDFMSDIADAYESAYTIMLNLNKSWVQKQGDFLSNLRLYCSRLSSGFCESIKADGIAHFLMLLSFCAADMRIFFRF